MIFAAFIGFALADEPAAPPADDALPVDAVGAPSTIPVDVEDPPPAPVLPPSVPDHSLVTGLRAPIVALERVQLKTARSSATGLFVASGAELAVGLVVGLASEQAPGRTASAVLAAGGVTHATEAYYQLNFADRRHAAFVADLAEAEGHDAAWPALARSLRLTSEREARGHAFASGTYLGVLGAGLAVLALGDTSIDQSGAALTLVGATGLVHHVVRWRAATRLSVDLDTAMTGVPTRLPDADQ